MTDTKPTTFLLGNEPDASVVQVYRCQKNWDDLQTSGHDGERYCNNCKQAVHRVIDVQGFQRAMAHGRCVMIVGRSVAGGEQAQVVGEAGAVPYLSGINVADLVPTVVAVPMPADWAKVHTVLDEAWRARDDISIPKPPTPLILAGAAFSTANEIRSRWVELTEWANAHGFSDLFASNLPSTRGLDVAESIAGVSEQGEGWWPGYGEQHHERREKPSKDAVLEALVLLKRKWVTVVGPELASSTRPTRFTGHKLRRLLVTANPEQSPTWGNWNSASANRSAFTAFRKAINSAIAPMEVDEISFVTVGWQADNVEHLDL